MKEKGIVRSIDPLGRVVIPKEIRNSFEFDVNDSIEIYVVSNDEIILKRHTPTCVFCDSTENVFTYKGKCVCKQCASALSCCTNAQKNSKGK